MLPNKSKGLKRERREAKATKGDAIRQKVKKQKQEEQDQTQDS